MRWSLISVFSLGLVVSHPLCQNFAAPDKAAAPLQFCKHSNGAVDGTCCSTVQDGAIARGVAAIFAAAVAPVSEACKALQVV
jgi:hypothetical protein